MKKIYITQRYLKRIKHNVEKIRYLLFSTRQRILGFRLSNKKHQRTNSTYFFILITSSPNCVSRLLFIRHIHSSPDAEIWFDKILRRRVYCRCDCISRHYIYIFFIKLIALPILIWWNRLPEMLFALFCCRIFENNCFRKRFFKQNSTSGLYFIVLHSLNTVFHIDNRTAH